ncbi:MFS transporter [Aeromicrobium panaciterrae]
MLDVLSEDLDVSEGTAGLLIALPGLAACVGAPVVTVLAGRMDRRRLLLLLCTAVLLSNVWVALSPSFEVALIGRAVLGAAVGGFWTMGPPTAGRMVLPEFSTRATSLVVGGIAMATVASLPVGNWIVSFANWRWAFVLTAAFALIALLAEFVTLPSMPTLSPVTIADLGQVFSNPQSRRCVAITCAVFTAHFATYSYITPYLNQSGISDQAVPTVLLGFGLVGVASNFVGGWILDRRLRLVVSVVMLLVGGALMALALPSRPDAVTVLLMAAWGIAWGVLPLSLQVWILATAPRARDGGQAMFVSVLQLSLAAGSAVGGLIVDGPGIRADFALSGAILVIAGAAATVWLKGVQTRSPADSAVSAA